MGVLRSNLFFGDSDLEDCAADHAFNFFQGKRGEHGREDAIDRIRTALQRLGLPTPKDGPGQYGSDTTKAVLSFKSRPPMILGPGQRTPDAVVGRQTIVRLDQTIIDAGVDDPGPPPTPLEFGTTDWRFSFFGNTSSNTFTLFVSSIDGQDSKSFDIRVLSIDDSDLGAWRGQSAGPFTTSKKVVARDFQGSICNVRLRKELSIGIGGGLISGFIELRMPAAINPVLQVLPFADENFNLRSGVWTMTGQALEPRRDLAILSEATGPALSASASSVAPSGSSGIRALRRHTFLRTRHTLQPTSSG